MRKLCFILLGICISCISLSQTAIVDSFKMQLSRAISDKDKVDILGKLSRTLMNINLGESDKYGREMLAVAEMSRDRKLMVKALLQNGERYSYLAGRKDNIEKAISYYTQGLDLARKNKLDEQTVSAYLYLSEISRLMPDADKALNYCNQANSHISLIKNDSLLARVHLEYGSVYLSKNEKILALKNYMNAIRIAEDLKNNILLRVGYAKLSTFYAVLEDFDKAIDYQIKALQKLDAIKTGQTPYNKVQDYVLIGNLYGAKKNNDMATLYYEKSLKLADSLKFEPIKALGYTSILNNYLQSNEPQKALDYFNAHPQLKDFLITVNFPHFVDQSYAYIYAQLGKYDSAKYYYNKIAPFFEHNVSGGNQLNYYFQLGTLYKKTGEYDKSLDYLLKAKAMAEGIGELETMRQVAAQLDSLHQVKGDFKQALFFASLNHKYKDSLDKLGKEKDLMQIEVADEQQRQERIDREKLESKRKRDNIQYMLIVLGIAGLFVVMVMMGMFKVSATTIKLIGFFTFLMFFEFIFLIFKKNIYGFTQGEPWKDLLFMIGLAAVLLPLHHWLEHKVIHYLTSHSRLTATGKGLMDKILRRNRITKTPTKV
jgi:tetratricopeptide (TPR) repeat protein